MAQTLKTIKLDVSAEQSFVYLKCKQYDSNSRIYQIILTDQNKPMTSLIGNELITATMQRADGNSVDTVCQWNNGKLYLNMTDGMLAVPGDGTLEIRVYNGNNTEIISTMIAHVNVQRSTLPYDRMIKSDEFNVLNNLILSVMNMAETTAEVERLLEKIKTDIATYERDYNSLSQEAQNLINDLNILLTNVGTQENQRIANENIRITNENQRISNENERIANENARNQAEQKRENDTNAAIANANNAINNTITNINNTVNETITDLTNQTNDTITNANTRIDNAISNMNKTLHDTVENTNTKVIEAISNMNAEIDNTMTNINSEINNVINDVNTAKEETIIATNNAIESTNNANNAASNINQLNQTIANEEAIRIANEKQRIANEETRQNQEAERKRNNIELVKSANEAISNTLTVIENSNTATTRANAISDDLEEKVATNYFKGEKGDNGVITTLSGQFGLQVEGDYLVLYYTKGEQSPNMSVDEDGYLVLEIPETE